MECDVKTIFAYFIIQKSLKNEVFINLTNDLERMYDTALFKVQTSFVSASEEWWLWMKANALSQIQRESSVKQWEGWEGWGLQSWTEKTLFDWWSHAFCFFGTSTPKDMWICLRLVLVCFSWLPAGSSSSPCFDSYHGAGCREHNKVQLMAYSPYPLSMESYYNKAGFKPLQPCWLILLTNCDWKNFDLCVFFITCLIKIIVFSSKCTLTIFKPAQIHTKHFRNDKSVWIWKPNELRNECHAKSPSLRQEMLYMDEGVRSVWFSILNKTSRGSVITWHFEMSLESTCSLFETVTNQRKVQLRILSCSPLCFLFAVLWF